MFRIKRYRGFILVLCISALAGVFGQERPHVQALPSMDRIEWTTISDSYYGYSFQVPASWHKKAGVTPDRWSFYSDPSVVDKELHPTALPQGLIKVDFAADPVASWLPDPEVRDPFVDERAVSTSKALVPLLPAGTWTTVSGMPALIVRTKIDDGGPFVEGVSIYILAERMVYYLWIGYAPPTNADKITCARFFTLSEQIVTHILESFTITPEEK